MRTVANIHCMTCPKPPAAEVPAEDGACGVCASLLSELRAYVRRILDALSLPRAPSQRTLGESYE